MKFIGIQFNLYFLYFICLIKGDWIAYYNGLCDPKTIICNTGYLCIYGFKDPGGYVNAQYQNCISPPSTAVILSSSQMSTSQSYTAMSPGVPHAYKLIMVDIYYTNTWSNDIITFEHGGQSYIIQHTTSTLKTSGFCDSISYEVMTYNFTLPYIGTTTSIKFSITNSAVSAMIRNVHLSYQSCFPACQFCSGPQRDQCTTCYSGVPYNSGVCYCPLRQSYLPDSGCVNRCSFAYLAHKKRVCVVFTGTTLLYSNIYNANPQTIVNWNVQYDLDHIDATNRSLAPYYYGVFKYREGAYASISTSYHPYPLVTLIHLLLCNSTPPNSGISYYINSTYVGSIFYDGSNFQLDNLILRTTQSYAAIGTCINNKLLTLESYNYIESRKFTVLLQGNFTQDGAGWMFKLFQLTTGYCPNACLQCTAEYYCISCLQGYVKLSDGTCQYWGCPVESTYNGTHCVIYGQRTKYSKFLVKEFYDFTVTDTLNQTFILESSTTEDLQKGDDIFWSYSDTKRVFGGKFVWAQAKFSQLYNLQPHHSLTIYFIAIFGSNFPTSTTNYLSYTINNGTENKIYKNSASLNVIYEVSTYNPTLTIAVQCVGTNNNVIDSYCSFSNYYIVVHYCQPYCNVCTSESVCTSMQYYDSTIIQTLQTDCLFTNQFVNQDTLTCEYCPNECLTCASEYNCLTCQANYKLVVTTCILNCAENQYYDGSSCLNCQYECKQCSTFNYCIHCESKALRYLVNGNCLCYEGYYDNGYDEQCQTCHQLCVKCFGPTNNNCSECKAISNVIQTGNICQCVQGYFYNSSSLLCEQCSTICNDCFGNQANQCISCKTTQYRSINGFSCICQIGYYDNGTDICQTCPATQDNLYSNCFKSCGDGTIKWHNQACSPITCSLGYNNINNQCLEYCGDAIIVGQEECDDGNNIQFDGCYNCRFQCPQECTTCDSNTIIPCSSVCGDGIISGNEECDDSNSIQYDGCYNCKKECQIQCTKCTQGICSECLTVGWVLNPSTFLCVENCGDAFVVGSEQCDDGYNFDGNDSCLGCKRVCRDDCLTCSDDGITCLECKAPGFKPYLYYCINNCGDGYVAVDPYNRYFEQCDDFNLINLDGCSATCLWQCQVISICTSCVSNKCQACVSTYYLDAPNNKCVEICNDGIVVGNEQCEDVNSLMYDGCYNCKFQCQKSCITCGSTGCTLCQSGYKLINKRCQSICGDKLIVLEEDCDDGNLIPFDGCHQCRYQCQFECKMCHKGICLQCQTSYLLSYGRCHKINSQQLIRLQNELIIFQNTQDCKLLIGFQCLQCYSGFVLNFETQQCYELCGDKKIVGNETCEDQNNLQDDGCYDCQFQCNFSCIQCEFGKCKQCNTETVLVPSTQNCEIEQQCENTLGYYLDTQTNSCYEICGDNIISQNEQCDDGNTDMYDGCYDCKYQCELECKNCIQGICKIVLPNCPKGYYINYEFLTCESYCGDGIVTIEEECDDGNEIDYDDCFNCKLQCNNLCQTCLQQNQCLVCKQQYELIEGQCYQSQQDESCNIKHCTQCNENMCQNCDNGYYLKNFECTSVCGDGIIADTEICDDGNSQNGDGCNSNCSPSQNTICNNDGECVLIIPPYPKLNYIEERNGYQYVLLTFSQKMKLNQGYTSDDLIDSLTGEILNNNITVILNFTINNDSLSNNTFNYISIKISILFNKIVNDPIFRLYFLDNNILINSDSASIDQEYIQIRLLEPNILNLEQQQSVQSLIELSDYNIKIIAIIIAISTVTGKFDIISNQLDLIQQMYYFKYLNTRIGLNLQQFFQTFKIVQLTNLYDIFGFQPTESNMIKFEYFPSTSVFEYDDRNANFIVNLISLSFVFIIFYCSIKFLKLSTHFVMKKLGSLYKQLPNFTQLQLVHIITKNCNKIAHTNIYQQYRAILTSIIYEYGISTFLSIKYQNESTFESILGKLLSLLLFCCLQVYLVLQIKFNNKQQQFKNSLIYGYVILQRLMFTIILIFFHQEGKIQIMLCLLNEFHYFCSTFIFKPFESEYENFKQYASHIIFFIISIIYLINDFNSTDTIKLIFIGWIIITLMCSVMTLTLLADLYQIIKPLINKIINSLVHQKIEQANHTMNLIDCSKDKNIKQLYIESQ